MTTHFDAIVVGAGQAGPSLVSRLSKAGMKVGLIERKLFGGTCVNTGCTPTKTMVASAYAAHLARRASQYGVATGGLVTVDMAAVQARAMAISGKSRVGIESWMRGLENVTVYQEHARFISPREMRVGADRLSAGRIFLNVGGRAKIPSLPGLDEIRYLTNTGVLELDSVPPHLVVVGGGSVGLEFAQMFRRFGSAVTIVEMGPRLVQHEDADVSDAIREILEAEDIQMRLGAECIRFEKRGEQTAVLVNCKSGEPEIVGTHVLLAMGRIPNTDDLGLKAAGVEMDLHGFIVVDDQLRTNVEHIWALGDCNGRGAFTHTSYNDYEIAAANLLDGEQRRVSDRIQAHALYVDPPLGQIGMTEAEVRRSGRPALIGKRPMTKVARAIEKGETQGFIKVLVDVESRLILGATILGVGGDEAIHCILTAMYARAPYILLTHAVHIHPTVSELIPTVLEDLKPLE